MKQLLKYSVLVVSVITVVLVMLYNIVAYMYGVGVIYREAYIDKLNKSVIYKVIDIVYDKDADIYTVCFEDINEEAPTLNTTYKVLSNDVKVDMTYKANWLRITARHKRLQAYKDLIAMDFTEFELTDDVIERVKIETVDTLALMQKERYKGLINLVRIICISIECISIIFCIVMYIHTKDRLQLRTMLEEGGENSE